MANVKQTQKMIPFITCDFSLGQYVCELVFGLSTYLIWILGSKLILSNNQSRATLWVLETCLTVGLLPLIIILITASLSSNTWNKASWREELTFEGIKSTLSRSSFHEISFAFEALKRMCVCGDVVHMWQTIDQHLGSQIWLGLDLWFREQFPAAPWVGDSVLFDERDTSITTSTS